ncbi:uncharacterized protein N7496_003770 [Penicillium cataractarum]|uniref:Xylanolytic transcriptional activator regulatory domain-containing protein n=1 Tax=Penicillium cataractarum TaxID=2100454 RepID=A0A9W9VGP8_9EURO|nr:uncharacterized protein N7496_003770 [Penicillium cataractarum]KAJ5381342.1 hypothetical protein N7496_003770 [Penicillium cataractarum]
MKEDLVKFGVTSTDLDQATSVHKQPILNEGIARGCRILSIFQNRAMIDRGIELFFKSIECIHIHCGELIVRHWLSQLWLVHGETLSSQDASRIRQLSQLLCDNTATPLVFNANTTAIQWAYSATGKQIRWGVIAMIANYVGTYALITPPSDPFFQDFNLERKSLLDHMNEVVDACLDFCRQSDALDDTFICALFEHYNITRYTKGETCYKTYCLGAELNSAFIAMGLHQNINSDSRIPFFLTELRKRLRAMVYMAEIGIATFLGRPPRLSHRYIDLDPPLDLTDSQLFSEDPQELAIAITELDEQGYNRNGEIRDVSWIRSSINFTVRREEILELSLGNCTPDEVQHTADAIQRKTEEHWANLPAMLLSLRASTFEFEAQTVFDLHIRHVFRQGPQANSLLLHRVLMHKAGTGPAGLIHTAQTILSDVMRLYKRAEMAAATSFIYFLAVHGLRSAILLASELLEQERLPLYPNDPLLPRSKTIQDLAVFAEKLNDLDPMFGDKDLCEKGRKVLQRVLDKILSPRNTADRHWQFSPMQQSSIVQKHLPTMHFQARVYQIVFS